MAKVWFCLVSFLVLWTSNLADEVDKEGDAMEKAIAEQNKKVEENSEAMVRAIDEKGKLIETKQQEEKFQKASDRTDVVGAMAEKKLDQKADLVDKLADDANTAIENQAKKVEALGAQDDVEENHASKHADKIGKRITKAPESEKPKSRMSISYTVHVPHEPTTGQILEKALFQNEVKPEVESREVDRPEVDRPEEERPDEKSYPWPDHQPEEERPDEKTYPWPAHQELQGYIPPYVENQEDTSSDVSLKPFKTDNAEVDHDALSNDPVSDAPSIRRNIDSRAAMFYLPHARAARRHHHLRGYPHHLRGYSHHLRRYPHPMKAYPDSESPKGFPRPTTKSSDLGLLVIPSGGPQRLPEDVRNQLEDDQLLRKAAKQAFNNDEDMDITNEMRKTSAEKKMERQWMAINAIGSPEMLLQWPRTSKKLGAIGRQQVSIVSPGEIDLLQTEYPEYPRPKALGSSVPGVQRSLISKEIKSRHLKKLNKN